MLQEEEGRRLTGMWIGMQEACLQELDQVAVEQGGAQLSHISCIALAQLLTCTAPPTLFSNLSVSVGQAEPRLTSEARRQASPGITCPGITSSRPDCKHQDK